MTRASDFAGRKIISGFMKDKELGEKRLASMPDRVTNTINTLGEAGKVHRPTVISCYDGDMSSMAAWWPGLGLGLGFARLGLRLGPNPNPNPLPQP